MGRRRLTDSSVRLVVSLKTLQQGKVCREQGQQRNTYALFSLTATAESGAGAERSRSAYVNRDGGHSALYICVTDAVMSTAGQPQAKTPKSYTCALRNQHPPSTNEGTSAGGGCACGPI